jgi:hypothetical protein
MLIIIDSELLWDQIKTVFKRVLENTKHYMNESGYDYNHA